MKTAVKPRAVGSGIYLSDNHQKKLMVNDAHRFILPHFKASNAGYLLSNYFLYEWFDCVGAFQSLQERLTFRLRTKLAYSFLMAKLISVLKHGNK